MKRDRAFCVNCGKETDALIDGLCGECYSKKGGFSAIDNRLKMEMCSVCGSIKYRGRWFKWDIYEGMKKVIADNLSLSPVIKWKRVDMIFRKKGRTLYGVTIELKGEVEGNEVKEILETEVLVTKIVCPTCSRKAGKYYEAVIQIRTDGRDFDKGEREAIERYLMESINKLEEEGRSVFISDKKETKRGVDFYISDKRVAHSLIYQMRERFGGEIKSSAKLFGVKDGIRQYRMTYLLRLHKYREHDVIVKDEKILYIKKYSSDSIKALDLKSWKEHTFRHKEIEDFNVLKKEDFVKEAIIVSKRGKEVQILDPDTYKTIDTIIPEDIDLGESVKIVKYRDNLFLIPPLAT